MTRLHEINGYSAQEYRALVRAVDAMSAAQAALDTAAEQWAVAERELIAAHEYMPTGLRRSSLRLNPSIEHIVRATSSNLAQKCEALRRRMGWPF